MGPLKLPKYVWGPKGQLSSVNDKGSYILHYSHLFMNISGARAPVLRRATWSMLLAVSKSDFYELFQEANLTHYLYHWIDRSFFFQDQVSNEVSISSALQHMNMEISYRIREWIQKSKEVPNQHRNKCIDSTILIYYYTVRNVLFLAFKTREDYCKVDTAFPPCCLENYYY